MCWAYRLISNVVDSWYFVAEIEDRNVPFTAALFAEPVSDGSCGRLVNDPRDVQNGDSARVLRSLTLRVIEVYRRRDHSIRDGRVGSKLPQFPSSLSKSSRRSLRRRKISFRPCNNTQRVINGARMKNIHQEETYEGRNVLSQYDRPDSSRDMRIFFFSLS